MDWFALECFRNRKNISIYTSFGRNRPIALINGYNGLVHHEPFQTCRSRLIRDEVLRWSPLRCVIKRLWSPSLDRDPTPWMHPARLNMSRYNSRLKHVSFDEIRWTASPLNPRAMILRSVDPVLLIGHVSCTQNTVWNLVPHGKNKRKVSGLYCGAIIRVSLNSEYGMLICTITL